MSPEFCSGPPWPPRSRRFPFDLAHVAGPGRVLHARGADVRSLELTVTIHLEATGDVRHPLHLPAVVTRLGGASLARHAPRRSACARGCDQPAWSGART